MEPIALIASAAALVLFINRKKTGDDDGEEKKPPLPPGNGTPENGTTTSGDGVVLDLKLDEMLFEPPPIDLRLDERLFDPLKETAKSVERTARSYYDRASDYVPEEIKDISSTDALAVAVAVRSGDPAAVLFTGAGTVAGVGAVPAYTAGYVMTEIYRRAFGIDMVDGFRSIFGQDRLSLIRKAERKSSRARGRNQAAYGQAVFDFIWQNDAISLALFEDMAHRGGYRPFIDRLREMREAQLDDARSLVQSGEYRDWLDIDSAVWGEFSNPDAPEGQIESGRQLVQAGVALFE